MSIVGQYVLSFSQYNERDYGTSELESIPRKKADEPVGLNVCVGSAGGISLYFKTEIQHSLGNGRTKYYPSYSARALLKDCFAGNPSTHIDPHQQIFGSSANQMIQFAWADRLEGSLATFGMLLKINSKVGRAGG